MTDPALSASTPPGAGGEVDAEIKDLPLFWQGRANALRILDRHRTESDYATLETARVYEKCATELRAALSRPVVSGGGSWQCFHCDVVFDDRAKAEEHFGTRQYDAPLCVADQFELVTTRKERDEYGDTKAQVVGQLIEAQEKLAASPSVTEDMVERIGFEIIVALKQEQEKPFSGLAISAVEAVRLMQRRITAALQGGAKVSRRRTLMAPLATDLVGLINADELRYYIETARFPRENGFTHERIAAKTNLTAGFIGMVLSGAREPSKAFLDATGFERVVLYRMKKRHSALQGNRK